MNGAYLLDQRVEVTAKRNRCCSFCGGSISTGEPYDFWSYKLKTGEFAKVKACCVCDRFADDFLQTHDASELFDGGASDVEKAYLDWMSKQA